MNPHFFNAIQYLKNHISKEFWIALAIKQYLIVDTTSAIDKFLILLIYFIIIFI